MCSFCYVEIFSFCSTPSRTFVMKVHSILTKEFFHLFSECLMFLFKSIYVFYCTLIDFCLVNHRSISRTIQSWWIIFLMYVSNQFSVCIKQETQEWVLLHHFFRIFAWSTNLRQKLFSFKAWDISCHAVLLSG